MPTWSTPTIHEGDTRTELIVNGHKHAGAYDPLTGQELWRLGGGGDIPVPTPIVAPTELLRRGGLFVTLQAQANWKILLDRVMSGELDGAHMLAGSRGVCLAWTRANR